MTPFGVDTLSQEIEDVLYVLATGPTSGGSVKDVLESTRVDLKEEAGRRTGAVIGPSHPQNDAAARSLAVEAACMANSDGGGALVIGVADDGTVIGTQLDAEWLRRRIYDLTERELTCEVATRTLSGQRVIILRCPEAVEPIRVAGKVKWRVNDSCVEVDAASWHDRRNRRIGYDWSAVSSGHPLAAVRAPALERARDFLRASGEEHALDLAGATDIDLLTRLNVVLPDATLSNAGAVAFVGRDVPAVDYVRRESAGGDSTHRLRPARRGLVEELYDIEQAIRSANPVRHVSDGLVAGQVRQLPEGAVRETIVNGSVHRDWHTTDSTVVEHEGARLVVTSPGGFVGGVNPTNIITYPSQPRNRALAELFAALRVAEREGVGVDRMVREMVRHGHPAPVIEEIGGPRVRAVLVGDLVDQGWVRFVGQVHPAHRTDLNSLLLLRRLVDRTWVDQNVAAPVLQRTSLEAAASLRALESATVAGGPVLTEVAGVPADGDPAWRLSAHAVAVLTAADRATGQRRRPPSRSDIATDWARHRGRISTTELGSIVGASPTNVGGVLKDLERAGVLAPGRDTRRGAGFFYVPADR